MSAHEKKILIVDNEPDLTNVLKIALEGLGGFRVQTENNPLMAVTSAKQFGPDLIIMDIKMPALDGADVAVQLKDEAALSEVPIIFLTGAVSVPEIVHHGRTVSGLRFLPKTMRLDAMVACLRGILRNPAALGEGEGRGREPAQQHGEGRTMRCCVGRLACWGDGRRQ